MINAEIKSYIDHQNFSDKTKNALKNLLDIASTKHAENTIQKYEIHLSNTRNALRHKDIVTPEYCLIENTLKETYKSNSVRVVFE
jgi:hypothetical protein